MEKIIKLLMENRIMSISMGIILLIAGVLSRIQFVNNSVILGYIIPLIFVSLSFGTIFSAIFKKDGRSVKGLFIKSVLAPWAIVIAITSFNKLGIQSPMIKAGSLFLINIVFFNKEISKASNQ
ncbi:hypothetical protein [Paramaledivibacter caminithermalis]|jgi:hypothetical protein|uniref:Uncharacterized protein n=1 Tax=Paramaledivibacter caminithermalis (strain DSM 15212 / CIP 107654 / DViRD3) TaxID=1121301 RepID=A0A1M6LEV2_PARC5|nr:hypothetical protein [Paramaledivibacter caminithermalis]SHJ69605.1 hypothetical protein SAMN02745912_00757 [Paramaledivibacter caminithermalis DSM 15212]